MGGGTFYLALRAQAHRQASTEGPPGWVHVAYAGTWLLSIAAAVLALFGAGGFKVAVLAIVPIVLLAPPALLGIRTLLGRPAASPGAEPNASVPGELPSSPATTASRGPVTPERWTGRAAAYSSMRGDPSAPVDADRRRMTARPGVENRPAPFDGALESWRPGPVRQAIVDFVARACGRGDHVAVPVEERVAVFDNDGTLWCEKPMPIQLDFILRRLVEMVSADSALAVRQPWKAACEMDSAWLSSVITDHYAGDDGKVKILAGGILAAYDGMSVEDFEHRSETFLRSASNRALQRGYLQTAYRPMVDLLDLLAANGFTNYIASGGGRDFMRPVSDELYHIPRERVIGSTATLAYAGDGTGGTITHTPAPDYLDDGPQKPIRIWSRVGRRPLLAAGNTDGDGAMLDFTRQPARPSLRLLVLHDDADREFAYTAGSEKALEQAASHDRTVVSMKNDWTTVF